MTSFLSSEIGRGHPFYLDGLIRAIEASGCAGLIERRASVFDVSRGLSLLAWKVVRASYGNAGRGGWSADLYHRVRGRVSYNERSALLALLGRDLRAWAGETGRVFVDHPAIVGALGDRGDVWYMHGEMVVPEEAVVRSASRIFVPTEEAADEFVRGGVDRAKLLVTGVCVENELVPGAVASLEGRRVRIASRAELTVAFFSSGAEPPPHVEVLARGAAAIAGAGHAAVVFAKRGGRLERRVLKQGGGAATEIVSFETREELDRKTAERFARFDIVVSPPHERSSWAFALGVPFFLVGPDIGPFAPRNRKLLLRTGAAAEIASPQAADRLHEVLHQLRGSGDLLRMSKSGGTVPFRGFERAAQYVIEELDVPRERSRP
jgi:hypothetical protein